MSRKGHFRSLAAAFAASAACLAPAAASADTVTMGSTLAGKDDGGISSSDTVSTQIGYDPAFNTNPVVSPGNGIITGWKVKTIDDGAIYTLKVLHANGPVPSVSMIDSSFTGITSVQAPSAIPAGTAVASPNGEIFSYPASLPIAKGDYVGLLTGGANDELPQTGTSGLARNLISNNFAGQPTDGSAAILKSDEQHDLLLQATVKFCKVPDFTNKTQAEATTALTAADCTLGGVTTKTVTFKKKKVTSKKAKKKQKAKLAAARALDGKVASSTPAAAETAVPGTAVSLTLNKLQIVKAKKKKKK